MEATADKHIRYGFMETEVKELLALAVETDLIHQEFDELYLRATAELPAWTRTQFELSEGIAVHRKDRKSDDSKARPPASSI